MRVRGRAALIEITTEVRAEEPAGASFIVDRCPFRYGEQINLEVLDLEEDKVLNWPMVYILANEDSAYVGQTTSVATRMTQHGASVEKRDFTMVNIIFNEEFNSSVVTDYEHRLIGLMHADGRYQLTNKNDGMTDTNYFSKEQYSAMFESLWDELRSLELVDHTIDEIEESEVFKYSPYKGLTVDQRVALDKILAVIGRGIGDAAPLVVEGVPGTGKTILAIYLLKTLRDDPRFAGMNIRILEPVTSLRETLRKALAGVRGLSPADIIGPADLVKPEFGYRANGERGFDILLVDEAHKLKRRVNLGSQYRHFDKVNEKLGLPKGASQMQWVLEQARFPIFFYDPRQFVGPSCVTREDVESALGEAVGNPIRLETQMRVRGGDDYLDYVFGILNGGDPLPRPFEGYEFVLHEDFRDFVESFERTYAAHDLSRMIAGYAWPWLTKPKKGSRVSAAPFDIEIEGVGLRWNCTSENWVGKGADNPAIAHEVGCIHSIQGYDLSYAYVIIGDDLVLDEESGRLRANRAGYYDRNGYATATDEELTRFIKNIYYVLMTRGVMGTHVYVANPVLRGYLRRFFA